MTGFPGDSSKEQSNLKIKIGSQWDDQNELCEVIFKFEGSKHSDTSRGVENPSAEEFYKRRRGDAVSIPATASAVYVLGRSFRGSHREDAATTNEVTASLTYELGSEHFVVQAIGRHGGMSLFTRTKIL
ncbi:hypothetical protein Sjap_018815 [Stephania japonica]|uniref:Uncharacterized protein n=1 Tax=Stephania japonica TaxID=461633 RepID=A0AAP0NLZ4_9MAGN